MNMKDNVLVSELLYQNEVLTTKELLQALIDGKKIKVRKAPKGHNYYLKDGQLHSDKITYLKGLPITWFNPDIKYMIDYD